MALGGISRAGEWGQPVSGLPGEGGMLGLRGSGLSWGGCQLGQRSTSREGYRVGLC